MTTKKCSKCRRYKRLHLFATRSASHDGLQSYCNACVKAYGKARLAKRVRVLKRFLTFKGCVQCGYRENADALQFHHRNGRAGTGDFPIMSRCRNFSKKRLKVELAKCDVMCANCHAIESNERARVRYA